VRVAFGTDESNNLTECIKREVVNAGHQLMIVADPQPWVDAGRQVAQAVTSGRADAGVVCCWTGTGVSIAANKVPGARAALCADAETARGARRWNDANVCALSLRRTSPAVAREVLEAFFNTPADPEEAASVAALG
jgi:ribose 5-phosphate isomerase B